MATAALRFLLLGLVLVAFPSFVSAGPAKPIYDFVGSNRGLLPRGDLVADSQGSLYGVTQGSGSKGLGLAYRLNRPVNPGAVWPRYPLTQFGGNYSGKARPAEPLAGLVLDSQGNVYGTTHKGGGEAPWPSYGAVFKLVRPASGTGGNWTRHILHEFSGTDGTGPRSSLVFDGNGALYGTTEEGGAFGKGVVFRLAAGSDIWSAAVIHHFGAGADGTYPRSGLALDSSENLYGTTSEGGDFNLGTVFRLKRPANPATPWTMTVLHSFGAPGDGATPEAGVRFDVNGEMYGTTTGGGAFGDGTVFKLARVGSAWAETVIHSFQRDLDGARPAGGVVIGADRRLFGATGEGGPNGGFGTVFELKRRSVAISGWARRVLYTFRNQLDGGHPGAGLVATADGLFGTTLWGGKYRNGTVFRIVP
jgi:uncharacterized repeat protein (TIGR03803 family)